MQWVPQKDLFKANLNGMFLFIKGCEGEFVTLGVKRFSLDFSRVVKKYRECVLEVECMREGVGLFRELIEFVTTEFLLFWWEGSRSTLFF